MFSDDNFVDMEMQKRCEPLAGRFAQEMHPALVIPRSFSSGRRKMAPTEIDKAQNHPDLIVIDLAMGRA